MSPLFLLVIAAQPYIVTFVPIWGNLRCSGLSILRDDSLDSGVPEADDLVPYEAVSLVSLWVKVCKVNSFRILHVICAIQNWIILSFRYALLVNAVVVETRNELPLVFSHSYKAHKVALAEQGHDVEKVYLIVKAPIGFIARFNFLFLFLVPIGVFLAAAEALN